MTNPEIEELKSLVEQKYGKLLATTTDFEVFTLQLEKATGKSVSASTLKRLYGYVGDSHKPRITTLDVLAEYLGHKNYIEYVKWLKTSVNSAGTEYCDLFSVRLMVVEATRFPSLSRLNVMLSADTHP